MTSEEIAALTEAEVADRLSKVASARGAGGLSEEDSERLKAEFRELLARQREFKNP